MSAYWQGFVTGFALVMLPIIIVFFLAQRHFVRGITLTGLKG